MNQSEPPLRRSSSQRRRWPRLMLLTILILAMAILTWLLLPVIKMMADPAQRDQFQQWLDSFGVLGFFVMLGIQILQVIIAIIPGEPVEVVAGVLYGTMGGLGLCMMGIGIGSALIYYGVKFFGRRLVRFFISEEELEQYHFLNNTSRLEAIIFLLFLIPGTPKDALTYLAPLTPVRPLHFFAISMFARIPSVISSTYAGATLSDGNLWGSVFVFVLIGVLGLAGIWLNKWVMAKLDDRRSRTSDDRQ